MKEKKYKDVKGFEDKNTFHQFDQFETQTLQGAKNRLIYDFSFPIIENKTPQEMLTGIKNIRPWTQNQAPWALGATIGRIYGNPGDEIYIITSKDVTYTDGLGRTNSGILELNSDHLWNEYLDTVNQDEKTFFFDENVIAYLNYKPINAYGGISFSDFVDYFRAGYIEFSFKTNKQNCIIASGSKEIDTDDQSTVVGFLGDNFDISGSTISSLSYGDVKTSNPPAQEKQPYYLAPSFDGALINLNIEIKNGKICINYYDNYNRDDVNFQFIGNENVADNQWHHVVINFGRPGLIKEHGKKFNKKFVEIWVDGQLDKRFDDKVNEYQIFYPVVKWLFNSPLESANNVLADLDIETVKDEGYGWNVNQPGFYSLFERKDIYIKGIQHPKNIQKAFKGAIHLFAHGLNVPLSQYEIKRRFRLWKKQTKQKAFASIATAEMKMPTVSTNSKKALKLYWDDLVKDGKNGIELDSTFQVETYSVINKIKNSKTEIYNLDKSLTKNIEILENVRAAFTDNVIIYGPGMIWRTNIAESFMSDEPGYKSKAQFNPKNNVYMDSVKLGNQEGIESEQSWYGPRIDLPMSGLILNDGDRILLTGQIKTEDNGIWIFNGLDKLMTRPNNALLDNPDKTYVVYVSEGTYKNTYWQLNNTIKTFIDPQKWILIDINDTEEIPFTPVPISRWKDYRGEDRLINLEEDININNYDVIVFMNYPETNDEIYQHFPNDPEALVIKQYNNFVQSLKNVVSNGASLYVSSPRLAQDLGIAKAFTEVLQNLGASDPLSASLNPFQSNEPAERYFDNHRNMNYHVSTVVPGLTDKETYLLTDFINYIPENKYENDEYHAKYSYRQFGLQEGNEFIIPGLAIRKITENENLPGYKNNQRGTKPIMAVAPSDVLAGTVVTKLGNCYCESGQIVNNPYDDYATTIIVHNGQLLGNEPINGKIFMNCVEDGYTFSREEYNKAFIQVIPESDSNETIATRTWQYSTNRLNRIPEKTNIKSLTLNGQTTPTNGGGGPFIQATSNASNGIIRSESDKGNINYQSDLYPKTEEEIYPLQEIPVLSMTWLGLQWLAG